MSAQVSGLAMTGGDFLPWELWKSLDSGTNGCSLSEVGCLDAPLYLPAGATRAVDVSAFSNSTLDPVWRPWVATFRRAGV